MDVCVFFFEKNPTVQKNALKIPQYPPVGFRYPGEKQPHRLDGANKPSVNHGMNYLSLKWFSRRKSERTING